MSGRVPLRHESQRTDLRGEVGRQEHATMTDTTRCNDWNPDCVADGRGIAAALTLGASAVQMGTAYLLYPRRTSPLSIERLSSLPGTT
jgi:hypothetical protein